MIAVLSQSLRKIITKGASYLFWTKRGNDELGKHDYRTNRGEGVLPLVGQHEHRTNRGKRSVAMSWATRTLTQPQGSVFHRVGQRKLQANRWKIALVEEFLDEFEEPGEQMATGFLFRDSDIDEPMWKGPDGVLYEFNSDDSCLSTMDSFSSMSLGTDLGISDAPSEDNASRDSDCLVFLPTEYGIPRQALAYNMVPPSEVFATPPGPPSLDFVELSSDDELADAKESGIPNFVKAASLRMSTPPRKFTTRTWYPGYYGEEGVESSHANLENLVGDQEVPDVTANCETLFATPPCVEELGVLFPPNETLHEPTLGLSSLDAMIQNMIDAGTLGVEPIRPPEGMPVWNERIRRSANGTIMTVMEREDGCSSNSSENSSIESSESTTKSETGTLPRFPPKSTRGTTLSDSTLFSTISSNSSGSSDGSDSNELFEPTMSLVEMDSTEVTEGLVAMKDSDSDPSNIRLTCSDGITESS
ncbi:predicted protein [Arabidopsis lyrata subsp. lyrata]|uniref:Predicted protein n=1 Tax=Arabidopsis lyrata subsp. lyrata TaxID=81972 RepID=D7KIB8_ARALL|nr:predicted protein [Arabidopsis lyrata subsp. lyrata]